MKGRDAINSYQTIQKPHSKALVFTQHNKLNNLISNVTRTHLAAYDLCTSSIKLARSNTKQPVVSSFMI